MWKILSLWRSNKMGKTNMQDHEHIHFYCSKELREKMVLFRFDFHIKTQNAAIIRLVESGLAREYNKRKLEEGKSINLENNKNPENSGQ